MGKSWRVMVITGSRADFGYLIEVLRELQRAPEFVPLLVVTGAHLLDRLGRTEHEIEASGFPIAARVPIFLHEDEAKQPNMAQLTARAVEGFARVLPELQPDLVIVLGDRYEMFGAATAAFLGGYVLAHLAGGDVTLGAVDEGLRHAISKMSHLHFPTHEEAAARLRAMGEDPQRIFVVGSTGLDALLRVERLPREKLSEEFGYEWKEKNLLVTYHPETEAWEAAGEQVKEVLRALREFLPEVGMILTAPNVDAEGGRILQVLEEFAEEPGVLLVKNLGTQRYVSVLAEVDAVVGNSSSGLYEAPSLGVPTVNIGRRQEGRLRAASVVDCDTEAKAIASAVRRVLHLGRKAFAGVHNPYGDGQAASRVVEALRSVQKICATTGARALRRKAIWRVAA